MLTELRDSHRAFEAEYRRVANESLAMQREVLELQKQAVANQNKAIEEQGRSVKMQAQFGRLYRVALAVIAVVITFLLVRLVRL